MKKYLLILVVLLAATSAIAKPWFYTEAARMMFYGGTSIPFLASGFAILYETGDAILWETGDKILYE